MRAAPASLDAALLTQRPMCNIMQHPEALCNNMQRRRDSFGPCADAAERRRR
jgi:hypothetical protein